MAKLSTSLAALALISCTHGCTRKDSSSDATPPAAASDPSPVPTTDKLAIGDEIVDLMINKITENLSLAGLTAEQVAAIVGSARTESLLVAGQLEVDTGLRILAAKRVVALAPAVVKGAVSAVGTTAANVSDADLRATTAGIIVSSTVGTLGRSSESLASVEAQSIQKSMLIAAVTSLPAANLTGGEAPKALVAVTAGAVEGLPGSGVAKEDTVSAAAQSASAAVENLASASVSDEHFAAAVAGIASGTVSRLGKAGVASDQVGTAAAAVAQSTMTALVAQQLSAETLSTATQSVASGAVGALTAAGATTDQVGKAAQSITTGTLTGLATAGLDPAQLAALAGQAAAGAIQGLSAAGLTGEQIVATNAVASIVSGATEGAVAAGATSESLPSVMGSISGAAVGALSGANLLSNELKNAAVASVVAGSSDAIVLLCARIKTLEDQLATLLATTMQTVATQAVLALPEAGFSAADVAASTQLIVQTGVAAIANAGALSASDASAIAAKVVQGASSGTAALGQRQFISSEQTIAAANAAGNGAKAGLATLKAANVITSDADLDAFKASISTNVAAGLQTGGAASDVIAGAQAHLAVTPACTASEYQSVAATATSPHACSALTACSGAQYEATAPTETSDRVCAALTACSVAQFETSAPTATSDRVCTALTACTGSQYQTAAAMATSDRACAALTACSTSQSETVAPTPTTDRVCATSRYVYVPGGTTNTVNVYTNTGTLVRTITAGLSKPNGVAVDHDGNVYVANSTGNNVTIYGPTGDATIRSFATQAQPFGLAVDSAGDIYVAGQNQTRHYRPDGTLVRTIPSTTSGPWGVAVDYNGTVYAAMNRQSTEQVHTYATTGTTATAKLTNAAMFYPYGIAVDKSGHFHTVNLGNNTLTSYAPNASLLLTIPQAPPYCPYAECYFMGVAIDSDGDIYVGDAAKRTVTRYAADGATIKNVIANLPGNSSSLFGIAVSGAPTTWGFAHRGANVVVTNDGLTAACNTGACAVGMDWQSVLASTGRSSGKWYFEVHVDGSSGASHVGIATSQGDVSTALGSDAFAWMYGSTGVRGHNGDTVYGASFASGDTVGIAYDLDAQTIRAYKNCVDQGVMFNDVSGTVYPAISQNAAAATAHFSSAGLHCSVPAGYATLDP